MQRAEFLESLSAIAAIGLAPASDGNVPGVTVPDSPLARAAREAAHEALPPEIYYHSVRTFLFAELLAAVWKLDRDVEAVYVASILHDVGLSAKYMSAANRFQVDSANEARAMSSQFGVTGATADTIWDAVVLHDQGAIAKWKQPEVRLVSAGVGADFGANLDELKPEEIKAVLAVAPRTNFIPVFLDAAAAFVSKKPNATGESWLTDVGVRMVHGFTTDNFVDDVRSADPFAQYR